MLRRQASISVVLVALVASATVAAPAVADRKNDPPATQVVATGLDSPRKLSFAPNGDLYIAESGAPSSSPGECFEPPQFGEVCVHATGAITRIAKRGATSRVVEGLPSAVSAQEANGPFDVLVRGRTLTIAMGLGGSLEHRDQLGEDGALLGTVVDVALRGKRTDVRLRADLLAWEAQHDPDGAGIDSNPVDLQAVRGRLLATDAGANDVLVLGRRSGVASTKVVLPAIPVPAPFPGAPDPFPMQPVPTATVVGPDGHHYISQLTGFPFPQGASTVFRLDGKGRLQPYATGLTNVTDLAWHGKHLYAVQISDTGISTGLQGSLVKVDPKRGIHTTVVDDLFAPYGVAIRGGYAYVTTGSVAPGGTVIKVRLP